MNSALLAKALEMPTNDKIELEELILASVADEDPEVSEVWNKEARSRMESVKEGKSRLLNIEDVFED